MKIIAIICYILQIIGLVCSAYLYPFGPSGFFADLVWKLTFMDGVPGFFFAQGYFFYLYLGWFFSFLHRQNKKKKEVLFYCPTCKEVYSSNPGSETLCLICRKKAKEIPILSRAFNKLPEDQQQMILTTALEEPVPAAPVPEAPPVPETTACMAPESKILPTPTAPDQPAPPIQPAAPVQPQVQKHTALLCLRSGPMAGRIFSLPAGTQLVAGRNPSRSSLPLAQYGKVSSVHCQLDCADGSLWVTDLGSTNGTFLNGQRLAPNQPASLREGDTLTLGTDECLFRIAFE